MLTITIPKSEYWNELTERMVRTKETTLHLEHSLVSISKWEEKFHKPFLDKSEKSDEELLYYVKCMCTTPITDQTVFYMMTKENVKAVNDYISDSHTATTVSDPENAKHSREIITSELIYAWMIQLNIPVEFQKWHLNRLLTLIRVLNKLNSPPKKMSKNEILARNKSLNAQRRAALHSKG